MYNSLTSEPPTVIAWKWVKKIWRDEEMNYHLMKEKKNTDRRLNWLSLSHAVAISSLWKTLIFSRDLKIAYIVCVETFKNVLSNIEYI